MPERADTRRRAALAIGLTLGAILAVAVIVAFWAASTGSFFPVSEERVVVFIDPFEIVSRMTAVLVVIGLIAVAAIVVCTAMLIRRRR